MPAAPNWHVYEYARQNNCTERTAYRVRKSDPYRWLDFCFQNKTPENWKPPGALSLNKIKELDKPFFKNVNRSFKEEFRSCILKTPQGGQPKIGLFGFLIRDVILECSWMLIGGLKRQNGKDPKVWWYERNNAWIETPLHLCCWHMHRRQKKKTKTLLHKSIRRQVDAAILRLKWRNDLDYRKRRTEQRRLHRQKNRLQDRAWHRAYLKKRRLNPGIRLKCNARSRFWKVMKKVKAVQTTDSFNVFIGCSSAFLRQHIEGQFEPWMNWDNYGTAWHVDHKKPLNHFDLFDPQQARLAFHFSNLKPVSKEYNTSKQDRWVDA